MATSSALNQRARGVEGLQLRSVLPSYGACHASRVTFSETLGRQRRGVYTNVHRFVSWTVAAENLGFRAGTPRQTSSLFKCARL